MSKALTFILLFLTSIGGLYGQEGNYPVSHFSTTGELAEIYPHQMIQDRHGMIFIACNQGVIRFDGSQWEKIQTPTSVFSLSYYGGRIYTAGPTGFGLLERGTQKTWKYTPLHDADQGAGITEMKIENGRLVGLGEHGLSVLNLKNHHYQKISLPGNGMPHRLISFKNDLYVTSNSGSPWRLVNDSTVETATDNMLAGLEFLSKAPAGDVYIGGSGTGEIIIYNQRFKKINWHLDDPADLEYLRESEVTDAAWVSDSLVALSSLKGGVIFIQPFKGTINKIVNASSGLPDNEVFEILADDNRSVWVAHDKGISRISPYLPYRTFEQYPGLEGNILSIKRHRGQMYVGTTEGLFHLKRIERVKKVRVRKTGAEQETNSGFWKKIWPFRKKQTAPKFKHELQSVNYVFSKVDGPASKVFNLTNYDHQLLAAGLDGLFLINGSGTRQLTGIPVRYAHYSPWRDLIYITAYDGGVYSLPPRAGSKPQPVFLPGNEPISYLFEDNRGNMYFCGVNTLFKVPRKSVNEAVEISHIANPFYEETYGFVRSDTVFFLHKASGDTSRSMIASFKGSKVEFSHQNIHDVIPGENGVIWVHNNENWQPMGPGAGPTIPDLSVFKNATYISVDNERMGKWIITGEKSLFFLENESLLRWEPPHSVFLYQVRSGGEWLDPSEELVMEQESGNVNFIFSQAEFTNMVDLQYQYYVEGLNENWSEWSEKYRDIDFSYIPAGSYTLHFRSRNSLGQVETLPPVYFKVLAPYWKQPWFYLVEFAFIGLMLLISVRMKAMGYKYQLMSRLLALLTLIIIIELIQILAESKLETETSPVVDFVIQVIIAIIVLPVEEILRKYIFKEKNVKVSEFFALREAQRRKRRKLALKTVADSETADK